MDYNQVASDFMDRMAKNPHKKPLNNMQKFSKGEIFALNILNKASKPLSAGDISNAMDTSSARVASLLNSLESKGFLERCIDPSDRRKIMVEITKKGKESIDKANDIMKNHLVSVFEKMGEKDTIDFMRLTETFFNLMHSSDE